MLLVQVSSCVRINQKKKNFATTKTCIAYCCRHFANTSKLFELLLLILSFVNIYLLKCLTHKSKLFFPNPRTKLTTTQLRNVILKKYYTLRSLLFANLLKKKQFSFSFFIFNSILFCISYTDNIYFYSLHYFCINLVCFIENSGLSLITC